MICGKSPLAKLLKKAKSKASSKKYPDCTYYITVTKVDKSTLEPLSYQSGKEISFNYMGKLIKDVRKVEIDGKKVTFDSRVILKAI
jgi:hypothetical protein